MTTLHHTIQAAMTRAKHNFRGDLGTPEGLEGFAVLARLYIETDVQAWIHQYWTPKAAPTCGAYAPQDADTHMWPCVLPAGHDPIAPNFRTHIDADGDTW